MTIDTVNANPGTVGAFDPADEEMLRYLGLDPRKPADRAAVAVARHYDLDPLLKHVVVIPKGGVYVTRDGLLDIAHRSGALDGITVDTEPTFDADAKEWRAVVTVWRKDMSHGFTYPGRYPSNGSNRDYPQEMALKCAEAHALRRAFRVTGLPVYEEQQATAAAPARSTGLAAAARDADPAEAPQRSTGPATGSTHADQVDPPVAPPIDPAVDTVEDITTYAETEPLNVTSNLAKRLFASVADAGIPKDEAHDYMSEVLGRNVTSSKNLTVGEARRLLRHLPASVEGGN